jgi:biopolymer transport protein TolQ
MTDAAALELILNASLLVQIVMGILLMMSVFSWFLIARKRSVYSRARKRADKFEKLFWKGRDISSLYNSVSAPDYKPEAMESIFEAGYTEFVRLRKQGNVPTMDLVTGTQRAMRVSLMREVDHLESYLSALATIGSVSPYIGLFGTVWGIMSAFHALADVQQATIAMVAPGISEALIATAMGLFAAIPAVIAYNGFANQVDKLNTRYDNFMEEFTGILQRQSHQAIQAQQQAKT